MFSDDDETPMLAAGAGALVPKAAETAQGTKYSYVHDFYKHLDPIYIHIAKFN